MMTPRHELSRFPSSSSSPSCPSPTMPQSHPTTRQKIADMTVIAFYYLLRPGEYTGTATDDASFRLQDLQLFIGDHFVDPSVAPISDLEAATSASLVFTNQKNGVCGEVVMLNYSHSRNPPCAPARTHGQIQAPREPPN
jgi:hypothetical protein